MTRAEELAEKVRWGLRDKHPVPEAALSELVDAAEALAEALEKHHETLSFGESYGGECPICRYRGEK